MAQVKGTEIVFIRSFMDKQHHLIRESYFKRLTPQEKEIYENKTSVSWMDIETSTHMFEKAAEVLYPKNPEGMFQLGIEQAKADLTGIYKVVFKMISYQTLIDKISGMWPRFHKKGKIIVKRDQAGDQGVIILQDYPDIPTSNLECIRGYIYGCMEMAGAKNLKIQLRTEDPMAWRWELTWN